MDMWGISNDQINVVLDDIETGDNVVEWGMGGTTERLVDRACEAGASVYSFESNVDWFGKMTAHMKEACPGTLDSVWFPSLYPAKKIQLSEATDIVTEYGRIPREKGITDRVMHEQQESAVYLHDYVHARMIPGDPTSSMLWQSNVFFVDGYARGACLTMIHIYAPEGSVVYLHDANRRQWYDYALQLPRFHDHRFIEGGSLMRVQLKGR